MIAGLLALLLCGVCFISSTSSNANFTLRAPSSAATYDPIKAATRDPVTWFVNGSNAADTSQNGTPLHPWASIQAGIDNALAGDTVEVAPFHYYDGPITISKSLTLIGEVPDSVTSTIIDGGNNNTNNPVSRYVVDINASSVTISGFTIQNATYNPHYGVNVVGGNSQINISGNIIGVINEDDGIYIDNSSGITIANNTILNTDIGVEFTDADASVGSTNIISDNNISATTPITDGVLLQDSNYTEVIGNNITEISSEGITTGISINYGGFENINGNVIKGNFLSLGEGLGLIDCFNSTFDSNNLTSVSQGTPDTPTYGISLTASKIDPSGILTNLSAGVQFNNFSNTTVEHFFYGMYMGGNILNTELTSNMSNNIVLNDTFRLCGLGIDMENTSSNLLYHNDFLYNTANADAEGNYSNTWNQVYPIGGNFWSDSTGFYSGSDTQWGENQTRQGSDMFGDTPYVGEGQVIDYYPLMKPWPMSAFWCLEQLNVTVLTSSSNDTINTITDLGFNSDTGISFDVTAKTQGSCAMIVPISLLDGAFTLTVDNVSEPYYLDWSNATYEGYHMINFTYDSGLHHVIISAEFIDRLSGDINENGVVDLRDLTAVAQQYGKSYPHP